MRNGENIRISADRRRLCLELVQRDRSVSLLYVSHSSDCMLRCFRVNRNRISNLRKTINLITGVTMNQFIFGISLTVYMACLYSICTSYSYTEPFIGLVISTVCIIGTGVFAVVRDAIQD